MNCYGDIDQNTLKYGQFTLGRESCMKFLVKTTNCTLRYFTSSQMIFTSDTANILQYSLNPEANSPTGPLDRVIEWK